MLFNGSIKRYWIGLLRVSLATQFNINPTQHQSHAWVRTHGITQVRRTHDVPQREVRAHADTQLTMRLSQAQCLRRVARRACECFGRCEFEQRTRHIHRHEQ